MVYIAQRQRSWALVPLQPKESMILSVAQKYMELLRVKGNMEGESDLPSFSVLHMYHSATIYPFIQA